MTHLPIFQHNTFWLFEVRGVDGIWRTLTDSVRLWCEDASNDAQHRLPASSPAIKPLVWGFVHDLIREDAPNPSFQRHCSTIPSMRSRWAQHVFQRHHYVRQFAKGASVIGRHNGWPNHHKFAHFLGRITTLLDDHPATAMLSMDYHPYATSAHARISAHRDRALCGPITPHNTRLLISTW